MGTEAYKYSHNPSESGDKMDWSDEEIIDRVSTDIAKLDFADLFPSKPFTAQREAILKELMVLGRINRYDDTLTTPQRELLARIETRIADLKEKDFFRRHPEANPIESERVPSPEPLPTKPAEQVTQKIPQISNKDLEEEIILRQVHAHERRKEIYKPIPPEHLPYDQIEAKEGQGLDFLASRDELKGSVDEE